MRTQNVLFCGRHYRVVELMDCYYCRAAEIPFVRTCFVCAGIVHGQGDVCVESEWSFYVVYTGTAILSVGGVVRV